MPLGYFQSFLYEKFHNFSNDSNLWQWTKEHQRNRASNSLKTMSHSSRECESKNGFLFCSKIALYFVLCFRFFFFFFAFSLFIYFMGLAKRTPSYVSIYFGKRTRALKIAYVKYAINGMMGQMEKATKILVFVTHNTHVDVSGRMVMLKTYVVRWV